jgi:hypothetical protein
MDTSGSWKTQRKLQEMITTERFRTLNKLIREQEEDDSNDYVADVLQYQPWMDGLVVKKW